MWWFIGIKQAFKKLEEEVLVLSGEVLKITCEHYRSDNCFGVQYFDGHPSFVRSCKKCGKTLEIYSENSAYDKAVSEWTEIYLGSAEEKLKKNYSGQCNQ